MQNVCSLSDSDLIARMPELVLAERVASHEVVVHLMEIERRRLYLDQACASLYSYCKERLGYSEDEALKRVRVARVALRLPQVLDELKSGQIHLTGLFLLSTRLTPENARELLDAARGRSRRAIEELLARFCPRPDVPQRIDELPGPPPGLPLSPFTCLGTGESAPAPKEPPARPRVEPLSATSYRVEFTASSELREKIERAGQLLSHVIPSGNLPMLLERALDVLIETETKKRTGAGKPRKQRKLRPGSRHVPVEVARVVWERDGAQCTFVDAEGRRCSERRLLTIEHRDPFAKGGLPSVEKLCLFVRASQPAQREAGFWLGIHREETPREPGSEGASRSRPQWLPRTRCSTRDPRSRLGHRGRRLRDHPPSRPPRARAVLHRGQGQPPASLLPRVAWLGRAVARSQETVRAGVRRACLAPASGRTKSGTVTGERSHRVVCAACSSSGASSPGT
jgi:hypothetical protein